MQVDLVLPKLGATMTDGVIAEWRVKAGDFVHVGDVLCDVESDKAVVEIESEWDATVVEVLAVAGQPLAIGTVIAHLRVTEGA